MHMILADFILFNELVEFFIEFFFYFSFVTEIQDLFFISFFFLFFLFSSSSDLERPLFFGQVSYSL